MSFQLPGNHPIQGIPLASICKLPFIGKLYMEAKGIACIGWSICRKDIGISISQYSFLPINIYSVVYQLCKNQKD